MLVFVLLWGGGVNAQLHFDNWDFEDSGPCLGTNGSYAIVADWNNISPTGIIGDGIGSCHAEVCNGERTLEFDWGSVTRNPMFQQTSSIPYTVRFLCTVRQYQPQPNYTEQIFKIKAYGRHTISGADSFLGEVEVTDEESCALKSMVMASNVSDFEFFVLRVEDYVTGLHCFIDDIEIPDVCSRDLPSFTINHDTEWNSIDDVVAEIPDAVIDGEVYLNGLNIAPYKKLTIGSDVVIHFKDGSHLLMWDHSKLDLWGTLTSCGNRWGGVRTYNHSEYRSFWGSELSNAVWGISSEEWSKPGEINYLGDATIESYGGLFLNNEVAIHLYAPFDDSYYGYRMVLENCVFRKNTAFVAGRFWGFISLNNMDLEYGSNPIQANIIGCHFLNDNPTNQFNFGIESYDSYFTITDYQGSQSKFKDLGYGIYANRTNDGFYSVRNTDFDDCAIGIGNRRISNSSVAFCTFNMGHMNPIYDGLLCCTGLNLQVGLSNNGMMTGYQVESNVFQSTTEGWTQGVNNYNVETADNLVYLNTFSNLYHGNSAGNSPDHTNALPDDGTGLHYLCNENENTPGRFDFFVRDDLSARMNQGFDGSNGTYLPARNTFSTGTGVRHFYQYYDNTNINYYALEDAMGVPVSLEDPTNTKGVTVIYKPEEPGCPQTLFREDNPHKRLTEAEKAEIEELYLFSRTKAMEANEAYGAATLSGKTNLAQKKRREYTYYKGQMEKAANAGLYDALLEAHGGDRSNIRFWMQRLENKAGDFQLIDDYMGTHEYQMAQSLLDGMEQKYDYNDAQLLDLNNMRAIYQIMMTEEEGDLSAQSLKTIMEFAEYGEGQARELARSYIGKMGVYYPQTIVFAEDDLGENNTGGQDYEVPKRMLASPNPAGEYVTFDWHEFDTTNKEVRIEITNKMGSLVQVLMPTQGAVTYEWTTEVVSEGICYYRLLIDNQQVDTGYLFITK